MPYLEEGSEAPSYGNTISRLGCRNGSHRIGKWVWGRLGGKPFGRYRWQWPMELVVAAEPEAALLWSKPWVRPRAELDAGSQVTWSARHNRILNCAGMLWGREVTARPVHDGGSATRGKEMMVEGGIIDAAAVCSGRRWPTRVAMASRTVLSQRMVARTELTASRRRQFVLFQMIFLFG